jgi:hypothetical protein
MATRRPAVTHEEMIAAIAELVSEVRHLREDAAAREQRMAAHVAGERKAIEERLDAIEIQSKANADFIKSIKIQGATWALAMSGIGVAIWQVITFFWDKVQIR